MSIEAVFRGFFNSGWAAVSAAYIAVIRFGKGPCDNGCSRCLTLIVLAVSGSSVHGASHAQKDQFMKKAESDMRAEYKSRRLRKIGTGQIFQGGCQRNSRRLRVRNWISNERTSYALIERYTAALISNASSLNYHLLMSKRKNPEGIRFLQYFGPLLDALRGLGGSGKPDEVVQQVVTDLALSDEEQNELVPSGGSRLKTNVAWARFYLVREGLLDSSKRGVWSLTEKGRNTRLSVEQAGEIFSRWVKVFDEQRRTRGDGAEPIAEKIAEGSGATSKDYRAETLELLLTLPPSGFERLAQRILREAGFTQVAVTGQSGDGGIDGYGTLQINQLLSFKVLFQCKRYAKSVSPSQVRDFRGAMAGRADKGIIITTGTFTAEARRESSRDGVPPIELIDGEKLVDLLESLELGLRPVPTYELDHAFFMEFRVI